MARDLFHVARSAGMVVEGSDGLYAELAVEVADRVLQIAFEDSLTGDPHVIDEGIALVTAYLETHATPVGIAGRPRRSPSPDQARLDLALAVEVGLDEDVGGVEVEVGVVDSRGADGVGAGVVLEVEHSVGVAPEVDAGEGLAEGPGCRGS